VNLYVTVNANGKEQSKNIVCWDKVDGDAKRESVMRKNVGHIDNDNKLSVLVNFLCQFFLHQLKLVRLILICLCVVWT